LSEIVAFLFPGQGQLPADVPHLGPGLARLYERVEQQGLEIREWIATGNVARLSQTDAAQPAVFLDALARVEALRSRGVKPNIVAGHSLGEYAALVACGTLSADVALSLVVRRGRLMAAVPGGMTAVLKLGLAAVTDLCAAVGRGATVANYNGAQQFVVSAPLETLDLVEERAAALGGRAIRLAVSGPFHSPAMRPAEEALESAIAAAPFLAPRVAFVSSVSGQHETDAELVKTLLKRQMTSPVRWTDVVHALATLDVTDAVELSAGTVLTQMGKRLEDCIRFRAFEEVLHA
jgi:[acyl-carrier-protein] S-malonyltransferase